MVEPRPTPVDTPDPTTKSRVLHYVALCVILAVLVVVVVAVVS